MLAYHNDPTIKAKLLADLQAHADHDRLVKGQYWENGKGCAVGCTLQSFGADNTSDHAEYERLLGIPQILARLEDVIFEGLPNVAAMKWPMRFSAAITPGADLSRVGWKFLYWLLTDELPKTDDKRVNAAIAQCAAVLLPLTHGEPVDREAADAARYAAAEAEEAADAAASASSASSAAYAARFAASAAAQAASAAAQAARFAAAAASVASAAGVTGFAASYQRMADKLIELLEQAK